MPNTDILCYISVQKDTSLIIFITALFIVARNLERTRRPSMEEWFHKCALSTQWSTTQSLKNKDLINFIGTWWNEKITAWWINLDQNKNVLLYTHLLINIIYKFHGSHAILNRPKEAKYVGPKQAVLNYSQKDGHFKYIITAQERFPSYSVYDLNSCLNF